MYGIKVLSVYGKHVRHCYTKNIFARFSSNYKRSHVVAVHGTNQLDALKETFFKQRTCLPPTEWQTVRTSLMNGYKHINENNIDTIVLGMCGGAEYLPLAKDYMGYLRSMGIEPKMASLGRLLRVYNAAYHDKGALAESEQAEVLSICAQMRGDHDMLDSTTCENLICGLVTTSQWRQASDYLKMATLSCTPSVIAFSEVAMKYFSMGYYDDGWAIMEQIIAVGKQPKCEIFIAYLQHIVQSFAQQDVVKAFEHMLQFLEKHEIVISEKVADYLIKEVATHTSRMIAINRASLDRVGKCRTCGNAMQNIAITNREFSLLSDSFLNNVLIRNDVFLKTNPEELQRFKLFVEKTAPYDCVIDGLNVAYSTGSNKSPIVLAKLLLAVVKYFNQRGKDVLVLGRQHMNNWPKEQMKYISKHAKIFLTNNLSQDDPFLLYASLKSGQSADFFSRDLMRSHAYLLDTELKSIFRRWQQEHQYSLITQTHSGKIVVKEPIRHRLYAHRVGNYWHLPLKAEYSVNISYTFTVADRWLCIKLQNSSQ